MSKISKLVLKFCWTAMKVDFANLLPLWEKNCLIYFWTKYCGLYITDMCTLMNYKKKNPAYFWFPEWWHRCLTCHSCFRSCQRSFLGKLFFLYCLQVLPPIFISSSFRLASHAPNIFSHFVGHTFIEAWIFYEALLVWWVPGSVLPVK